MTYVDREFDQELPIAGENCAEAPWLAEASLHMPAGAGLILTPGLVAARSRGITAFALAVRAQWLF